MKVGVPRETAAGERRVALVPETVKRLAGGGFEVAVERGAGEAASFPDPDYEQAGATLVDDAYSAEAVVKVQSPSADEATRLRDSQILIGFLQPLTDHEGIDRLSERGVVAFAMESIPRITRAQAMDALSSQATVSGYKAAVLAADRLPKFFPMLMTAAGTVAPAKVLVLGAGVAGLQAIATARRLGAVVSGFDVRPIVREQVESLGATFLDLGVTGEETAGGYARELTEEEHLTFVRHFGPLETSILALNPDVKLRVRAEIADVSNLDADNELWRERSRMRMLQLGNRLWHTDSSFKYLQWRSGL